MVALAIAPAVAAAAPSTTVKTSGLRVSWPAAKNVTVAPGTSYGVRVHRTASAPKAAKVRVTVTRLKKGAQPAKVVLRQTIRRGTATLRVAKQAGTSYRVVVRVGKRSWRTTVTVGGTPSPSTPPAPKPGPTVPYAPETCAPSGYLVAPTEATIRPREAGGSLQFSVVNNGRSTLVYGMADGWERLDGATWTWVAPPAGLVYPAIAMIAQPGDVRTGTAGLWWLTPGTYRVTLDAACLYGGTDVRPARDIKLVSGPVTVTAAPLSLEGDIAPLPW